MASLPDVSAGFLARLRGLDVPEWSTPDDLGRMGIEAMAAQEALGRELPSHGVVRLIGPAVTANSAPLDSTGDVLVKLQKLVTAVGASIEGIKSQVGPLSDRVRTLTQLRLVAGSAPGSVQLFVVPQTPPPLELYPGGQHPLVDDQQPLVDRSAETLLEVLAVASDPSTEVSALADRIDDLGARVAAGVRNLAGAVVDSGIEVEWSWAVPRQSRRTAQLSTATARLLSDVVAGRNLDVEEVTLIGVLHTISDTTAWELHVDGGERVRVRQGDISAQVTSRLHVGQRIQVTAAVEIRLLPGGVERAEYTAIQVTAADDLRDRSSGD